MEQIYVKYDQRLTLHHFDSSHNMIYLEKQLAICTKLKKMKEFQKVKYNLYQIPTLYDYLDNGYIEVLRKRDFDPENLDASFKKKLNLLSIAIKEEEEQNL